MRPRFNIGPRGRVRLDDAKSHRPQQRLQDLPYGGIVLDDQDLVHGLRHAGGTVGSVSSMRVPPPGRARASISPPWARTMARQMARPSPTPTIVPSPEPR